ncbi:hypothetical protein [Nocardia sp. NBC_01329]|uniref:hypothetical protein n=1 Tax=Nocardia sp. NBC_01329 TaxID=2903594 RepID=UPI002E164847|nr:hypothetical protein OG405_16120 [Nocardia sp. NBC_01329]
MGSAHTTREVVDLMIELGLVDASTPGAVFEHGELDEPLSYFGHTDRSALRGLLTELGIRYTFDYKTFRGIGDADDERRLDWYRDELESVAGCARGAVTIRDVRLVEGADDHWELQFEWNGVTEAWPVYPGDEEESLEAALTFATYVPGMAVDSVGVFCLVDPMDPDFSGEAVFGVPEALNRLGGRFGLTFAGPWPQSPEVRSQTPEVTSGPGSVSVGR